MQKKRFGRIMQKEIHEIPTVAAKIIDSVYPKIEEISSNLKDAARNGVTFVARGSSDNACLYGKYAFEILLGAPVHLAAPSVVTLYKKTPKLSGRLVVGVSQSGESIDVCEYVEAARDSGAFTVGITNAEDSRLARASNVTLPLMCSKERAVAATKTYFAQLFILRLIVTAISGQRRLLSAMDEIPRLAEDAIAASTKEVPEISPRYRYMNAAVVLGRGYNFATALEFALKLMETSYLPVHPFSFADFLHGPVAVLHEGFPTFAFLSKGPTATPVRQLLNDIASRGGESVVFTDLDCKRIKAKKIIRMPRASLEIDSPLSLIIPAYFFAHSLALERGYNPDSPRGLSKVTHTI